MPLVIVGPGNDKYSIPENPYGLVLDVNLLPDVNETRNKVSVLPGEVKKPRPAYQKTVEAQSGNLEQDMEPNDESACDSISGALVSCISKYVQQDEVEDKVEVEDQK
ncbi:hypothetical protein IW262DRAFT_1289838 [Armillaria fumosa]|nr:hypothetical protein IW262DRAFT_1289838 [Armillaria fumosa]